MRAFIALLLGLLLAANGIWMLYRPLGWYAHVPGVNATGAANVHFIRDIGCAYLAAALGLLWYSRAGYRAWPAVLAGGIFLTLHAFVHAWDMLAGRELMQNFRSDALAICLPALITLWLALSSTPSDGTGFKR